MARVLDSPRAVSSQPAAAKVLAALLEKLASASACGHRGNLSVAKSMTTTTPADFSQLQQADKRGTGDIYGHTSDATTRGASTG
jgi:hypothetical protein